MLTLARRRCSALLAPVVRRSSLEAIRSRLDPDPTTFKPLCDALTTPRRAGSSSKLSDTTRKFIVERIAAFDSPQTVVGALREEFGVTITRQGVAFYDPTVGAKPAAKWCALFDTARAAFLKEIGDIPIAQRAVRLRRLDRMAVHAEARGNFALAAALNRQAAEDLGGAYSNRRELTGADGAQLVPPATTTNRLDQLTLEQLVELEKLTKLAFGDADATEPA